MRLKRGIRVLKVESQRNTFPVSIFLTGEQEKAVKWLPWARNKLAELIKLADGNARSKVYDLQADGIKVELEANTNTAKIRITAAGGTTLESGFFDQLSTAPLNEFAYIPSFLHYGAEQVADYATPKPVQGLLTWTEFGHVQGEKLNERTSKAITNNKALVKTDPNGLTSPTAIYGDANMLLRKKAQTKVKPSMYPGFMRLYVQVLFGKLPCQYDFEAMAESLSTYPALALKVPAPNGNTKITVTLNHTGVASTWLMHTGDWGYYLVTASTTGLTLRKMGVIGTKPKGSLTALQQRQAHAGRLASSSPSKDTIIYRLVPRCWANRLPTVGSPTTRGNMPRSSPTRTMKPFAPRALIPLRLPWLISSRLVPV
jgi:hypothetical protein